jgi:hypothetical protein
VDSDSVASDPKQLLNRPPVETRVVAVVKQRAAIVPPCEVDSGTMDKVREATERRRVGIFRNLSQHAVCNPLMSDGNEAHSRSEPIAAQAPSTALHAH